MLTPVQLRAARAMAGLSQRELAAASGVGAQTIKNIEGGGQDPRLSTAMALRRTLEALGIVFMDAGEHKDGGPGVRLKV